MSCVHCSEKEGNVPIATFPDIVVEVRDGRICYEDKKWASVRTFPIRHCPMCGGRVGEDDR